MHAFSKHVSEYVVFDFARTNDVNWLPWGVIENMKNGWMTTTKYDGKMLRFNPCKIIVMMNQMPPEDKFSADRYVYFPLEKYTN